MMRRARNVALALFAISEAGVIARRIGWDSIGNRRVDSLTDLREWLRGLRNDVTPWVLGMRR